MSQVQAELNAQGLERIAFLPTTNPLQDVRSHRPDLLLIGPQADRAIDELKLAIQLKGAHPDLPIVVIVQKGSEAAAITALRAGLQDYIPLPSSSGEVTASILRALSDRRGDAPLHNARDSVQRNEEHHLVGACSHMAQLRATIERLAQTDATVLITGETGTGKDLLAELIHRQSGRSRQPLIPLNCAAIPDSLLESELFGYQRGAFTGAESTYEGKLRQANRGTVFLDEIGDMSLPAQAKLLRVIESKQVHQLGGRTPMALDVRILAATNQDLKAMMQKGTFRKDLYYRLNVAQIHVPPLRDRRADIPLLVTHFLHFFNDQYGRMVQHVSAEVMEALIEASWPGNVRELKSCVELAVLNCPGDEITPAHLPASLRPCAIKRHAGEDHEEAELLTVLTATRWNITKAARQLHWSRMTLYRKLARYNLSKQTGMPV